MAKHNRKNKERKKENLRPIEERSEKICSMIIQQLYLEEVCTLHETIQDKVDYSFIDISLNEGLVVSFNCKVDTSIFQDIEEKFLLKDVNYILDKKHQRVKIYK